jgi:glutamate formiminotransferase/glutamate formiminotransferase/formiminotetrahydrofolate cyclodeaminase
MQLLAVPNVSEGSDPAAIGAIGSAFAPARVLDVHSDPDHGRSVYWLAAEQGELADALVAGAREAVARIDLREHIGSHPYVGAIDVAPVVYLDPSQRGVACAEALTAAALLGDVLPVYLYGDLATRPENRERAALRAGGPAGLLERGAKPDHGPGVELRSGAVLVTARPPLIAFNVDLSTDDVELAKQIAAELRESNGGRPGVRAIGLHLPHRNRAQVSFNVHDHERAPLRELIAAVRERAPVAEAELVGLAPRAALEGLPDDVPLRGFDPDRHVIENALRSRP